MNEMEPNELMSNRQRILIISPYFAPEETGSAPYVTAVAEELARIHDVTVLCSVPHYPQWHVAQDDRRWRVETQQPTFRMVRLFHYIPSRQTMMRRFLYEASFAARCLIEARRHKPDLILGFSPPVLSCAAASLLSRFGSRPPLGIVVHDLAGKGAQQSGMAGGGLVAGLVGQLESRILRTAAGVVVLHERFKDVLVRDLNVDKDKVRVIRNWVHIETSTRHRQDVRDDLGWGKSTVVLHSGNMGLKQGLENVIAAARLSESCGSKVRFVFMGDGSQRGMLEQEAQGLTNVNFMPPAERDSFPDILAAADVLLVNERPGSQEMSVPSKLTSYFSAGRPVVAATTAGSMTEFEMRLAGAGPVVPAGDPVALLGGISDLLADSSYMEQASAASMRFANDHFSAEGALESYVEWVRTLNRTPAGRSPIEAMATRH